jgi:hypothetical protein
MKRLGHLIFFLSCFVSHTAMAALIDFETVPGATPSDQLVITDQYKSKYGITFSVETISDVGSSTIKPAYLEAVGGGDSGHGFWNSKLSSADKEATGHTGQLGDYFLRIGQAGYAAKKATDQSVSLWIEFTSPVSTASAEIWDIDKGSKGSEQWKVSAYAADGAVLDSGLSPKGIRAKDTNSLDGLPWIWNLGSDGKFEIASIQLEFVGTKATGVGLAFDNFTAVSAVPIPAAVWLFGSGLLGLVGFSRRKQSI